jgi:type IV pilus assembly protein PilV
MLMKLRVRTMALRSIHGVTMIEVLVTMVVTSIGLLGIAKMQALAISSTRVSSMRSLISIEASSLASAIHANRVYWSKVASPFSVGVTATSGGGTINANATDSALNATIQNCKSTSCAGPTNDPGAQMAAYDLWQWGGALYNVMPTSTGTVACSGTSPLVCTITVNWTENYVSMNAATQYTSGTQSQSQSFTLAVQP